MMAEQQEQGIVNVAESKDITELTSMGQFTNELFERKEGFFSSLGEKENNKPLDPVVIELSNISLLEYNKFHDKRDNVKVVGKVKVSEIDPKQRYMLTFFTTNVEGENDWRVTASVVAFDVHASSLDKDFPARRKHWVVGEKNGSKEIIGNYGQLYESSNGKLTHHLKTQGWKNISEIWAVDVNRHAGFLPSTTKLSAQIGK